MRSWVSATCVHPCMLDGSKDTIGQSHDPLKSQAVHDRYIYIEQPVTAAAIGGEVAAVCNARGRRGGSNPLNIRV